MPVEQSLQFLKFVRSADRQVGLFGWIIGEIKEPLFVTPTFDLQLPVTR